MNPALGAYSATEAPAREMTAPALARELPIEFFRRIAEFLKPGDADAAREMVERLEAGKSFEEVTGLPTDWRTRERDRLFRLLASLGFSAGSIAIGLQEGKRGEFPALAEQIVRLANGHRLGERRIFDIIKSSGDFNR